MRNSLVGKGLVLALAVFFISTSVAPGMSNELFSFNVSKNLVTTLYVGGSEPGNYSKIQNAIDNASDGDAVYVYGGMYYENVVIRKSISLIGENKYTTIIDSNGSGDVVKISDVNWVNISEFSIQNGGSDWEGSGISIRQSDYTIITNNLIHSNLHYGIWLYLSSTNFVSNNIITSNNACGINIGGYSDNNMILDNNISFNKNYGIHISYSEGNTISNNTISSNKLESGLRLVSSNNNTISGNTISLNKQDGVFLSSSNNNTISGNTISLNNESGIILRSSCINTISENLISLNGYESIYLYQHSDGNFLYFNNFINNTMEPYDESNNIWNNEYPAGGNYWSDYTGTDDYHGSKQDIPGGDNIGDVPYRFSWGRDSYPLILIFGENPPIANFSHSTDDLSATFDASSSFDRDGTVVSWSWNFGDNTSGSGLIVSHTYVDYDAYNVTLSIIDSNGYQDNISEQIYILDNNPPLKPDKPTGPTSGKIGREYSYYIMTTDPDGDQLFYQWDWGDGSFSQWLGPYNSGEEISASHSWSEGSYNIKVKSKDIHNEESNWSDPLPISMPKNKQSDQQSLQFLNGIMEQLWDVFLMFKRILKL